MNTKEDDWQQLDKLYWATVHQLREATFKVKGNDTVSTANRHLPFCQAGPWRIWLYSLHLSGSLGNWQSRSVHLTEFQNNILKKEGHLDRYQARLVFKAAIPPPKRLIFIKTDNFGCFGFFGALLSVLPWEFTSLYGVFANILFICPFSLGMRR